MATNATTSDTSVFGRFLLRYTDEFQLALWAAASGAWNA